MTSPDPSILRQAPGIAKATPGKQDERVKRMKDEILKQVQDDFY
jgi:hypothetical protein